MFKELKEIMTTISHQIENIIKRQTKLERKKKKNQVEILEFKSTIPERKKFH